MEAIQHSKTDKKLFTYLLVMLSVSFIFPEYLAPFFVFGLYIFFLNHFKKTNRNAKIGDLGKVFMAYMGYMIISSIWSNTHILSGLMGLLWMGCFLAYIEVANIVNTKERLKDAITALNVSSGIIGLIGILEYVTYNLAKYIDWFNFTVANPLFYNVNNAIFDLFPFEIVNSPYASRASATFDNPLILATFLVITTPFCAFGSVFFKHAKNRKISRVCFVTSLCGLICTESRGACIAIALSIVTMLISHKKLFKKLIPFVFGLAIAVPLALVIRTKNTSSVDFLASTNRRIDIWTICINTFRKHWLVGLGAGTENLHQILLQELNKDRAHAHNLFLQIIVEGGIIGGILVAIIVAVIVKNVINLFVAKDGKYRPYAILYTSSIIGFITISLFEHTLQSPKEIMVFFILLGFIEATNRMASDTIQLLDVDRLSYHDMEYEDYISDKEEEKEAIKK